jgi:hypothetical protein
MKHIFTTTVASLLCAITFAQPVQPPAPLACNAANCTAPASETCPSGSNNVVSDFRNGSLFSGSALSTNAVYRFANIATANGRQVNATITIDEINQAILDNIDDDAATDQNGNSVTAFFSPRIGPDQNLTNADRRGYVQFTIRFYVNRDLPLSNNDFDSVAILQNLNYIHYDIDGSEVGTGGWFREIGLIKSVGGSIINADASTELVSYAYPHNGFNWNGFAGSVCERTGLSRCAQVTAAAKYAAPQSEVTVRMGYDYNRTTSNFNSQPIRQYGSRFGCFSFPTVQTLPVQLGSFSGTRLPALSSLYWQTELELGFSHFELERSATGGDFETIQNLNGKGGSGQQQYQYNDYGAAGFRSTLYYRLKMVDKNGKAAYSNVIALRTADADNTGITITPNPATSGGQVNLRLTAEANGQARILVFSSTGKLVVQQYARTSPGVNTISIANAAQLQPGVYLVQVTDGGKVYNSRLVLAGQ